MSEHKFFNVKAASGAPGCPAFLNGDWNHSEWEWNPAAPVEADLDIKKEYVFTVTNPGLATLSFDYYGTSTRFVSAQFLDLCRHLEVRFKAIPLKLMLRGPGFADREVTNKDYFIFFPTDHLALLDRARSTFTEELVVETGEAMMQRYFPAHPFYARIDGFVPRTQQTPTMFDCIELNDLVCTGEFKARCLERQLLGLQFIPIDHNFVFDPFAI